jgi:lipopolysaccharide transport system permease protein
VAQLLLPWNAVLYLSRFGDLVRQLTLREVLGRYRGSYLGVLWSLLNPLTLLLVYTFVFGVMFKLRWGTLPAGSYGQFAVSVFAGMVPFGIFADSLNRASSLVTSVPNLVKKVVFPLEVLPVVNVLVALVHAAISTVILFVAQIVVSGGLPLEAPLGLLIFVPICLWAMGLGFLIAAAGVFLRDIGNTVGLFVTALFFLTPVFYPVSGVPEPYRWLLELNPMTALVEAFRWTLTGRSDAPGGAFWVSSTIGLVVFQLGFVAFIRIKKAFADVL